MCWIQAICSPTLARIVHYSLCPFLHHSEASADACTITLQHAALLTTYCRSVRTATWWPTAATDAEWRALRSTGWSVSSSAGHIIMVRRLNINGAIILDRALRDYP